jgi:dinuclear metal center YbgI/SA1388 family protein
MKLHELVAYLNEYLSVNAIPDWPRAFNGLQVENRRGEVERIAVAVDASEAAAAQAAGLGCDLLLVHHGLFWDGDPTITGRRFRKLKLLLDHDIAVYSAHLPLDVHPVVGNNSVLARALGIEILGGFCVEKGIEIGVWGKLEASRSELAGRLERLLGSPIRVVAGGPEQLTHAGVVTGAGTGAIASAVAQRLDALVTGEGPHHAALEAMEEGINVYHGGHYATETWGVRELAAHLESRFGLHWEFLDLPTGF